MQGLIRYLGAKYEFSDECLTLLPECVKHGINNEIHTMLIKGGLKDRIALHVVSQFIEDNDLAYSSVRRIKRGLKNSREDFEQYINQSDMPYLSKGKIGLLLS